MAACRLIEEQAHLAEVDYNDGLSNEATTWGYDVAGNRTSDSANSGTWTYDNLNRMSASPFGTYTNDILGYRTQFTTSGDDPSYLWDELNRMVEFRSAQGFPKTKKFLYQYRADGMRVTKVDDWNSPVSVTEYFYDGQMGIQDYWTDGTDTLLTKYGIGARGIDVITKISNGGSETFGYPIYDTHGNMVATLARNGSGYTLGNEQSYDVWGGVRSGSSSEDQGYVANLGHRSDPESFLTYMRARYYEPMSGRFISEDPAMDGLNWFVYARNAPTSYLDFDGKITWIAVLYAIVIVAFIALMYWVITKGPSKIPYPPGGPMPPITGDIAEVLEGSPTGARIFLRQLEKEAVMKDLIDDPEGNGISQTFDSDDSPWQVDGLWDSDALIRD